MTEDPTATAGLRAALWDDNPATTDLLGFDIVVDAVVAALREAHLDPITIGVHAPWGGGKSTVLGLIKAAKDEHWLVLERVLTERVGGPLNLERWAGTKFGSDMWAVTAILDAAGR
jgi:hypothetical protein